MNHSTSRAIRIARWLAAPLALLLAAAGCSPRSGESGSIQPRLVERPLDLAWTFAAAIDNDPDDRATYQAKVALAWLEAGDRRMALALGRTIGDWNRGVVLARVAESTARAGEPTVARELLIEAEAVAERAVESWHRDRIRLATANAVVLIGATNGLAWLSRKYANSPEYGGQMAAVESLRQARRGDVAEALATLDAIPISNSFDTAAWRARGYGLVARELAPTSPGQATNALAQMWAAAGALPGALGIELRLDVAGDALHLNLAQFARDRLDELDEALVPATGPAHVLLPLKTRVAQLRALAGDAGRAGEIVAALLPAYRADVMEIERPAMLAAAAEALALAGNAGPSDVLFAEAIGGAAALKNRRPRCIALCEIALRLESSGLPDGMPITLLREQASLLEDR